MSNFDWERFAREVAERTEGVERSPGAQAARMNAWVAVEADPVRRRERATDLRLAAAVLLAPRLIVCEALLAGVAVPAKRLEQSWAKALKLRGDVVLDDELALRVNAHGPLEEPKRGR
jgi:hypothetical protein